MADINSTNLSTAPPDFSMLALFMQADLVVKSVIIILILASLYSWNVIISKILRIRQLKKLEKEFEDIFWSGNSFEDLYETLNFNQTDPKSKLFCAAILEWKKSKTQFENDTSDINSLKDRMMRSMTVVFNKESENVERNLTFLATAGSTAPFIGLFGTVWGILNSFRGLAGSSQATLSAVGPGISEALIATAIGLFAAIPALIAYNKYISDSDRLISSFEGFKEEFSSVLHRDIQSDKK